MFLSFLIIEQAIKDYFKKEDLIAPMTIKLSFRSSLQSHPFWVTLDVKYNTNTMHTKTIQNKN